MRPAKPKRRDELERSLRSGRLLAEPCCHRTFVSELGSPKKERAAASMFEMRSPHRSSCSRRAKECKPSTEIRLDVNSLKTHDSSLYFFVPPSQWWSGRDPPGYPGYEDTHRTRV